MTDDNSHKQMRTRVKFCGITSRADAIAAARAGADAIGFVLHPPAAAAVTPEEAASIAAALPPFLQSVALLVDADSSTVRETLNTLRPDLLQFHGNETSEFCARFEHPYIKACRVKNAQDIQDAITAHQKNRRCRGILLDAFVANKPGGTGRAFDWSLIPAPAQSTQHDAMPLIIAGGLTPENVGALIRAARPWAVDVSGGICEADNRKVKNWDKMTAFIRSARDADIN